MEIDIQESKINKDLKVIPEQEIANSSKETQQLPTYLSALTDYKEIF